MKNMENQDIFIFLKNILTSQDIDSSNYEEYLKTLSRHDQLPCPFCFTRKGQKSPLAALPEKGGFEPLMCKACNEIYYKPVPKN